MLARCALPQRFRLFSLMTVAFTSSEATAAAVPLLSSQTPPSPSEPVSASGLERLLSWDRRVSHAFYQWYHVTEALPKWPLILLEISGHGLVWIIWPIVLLLLSPNMEPSKLSNLFHFYLLGLLDLAAIGILKPLFRRQRPTYNAGLQHATIDIIDQYSFPSGHASRSVSVAAYVFYIAYKRPGTLPRWIENPFFLAVTFAWGVGCAASRVALGRHHVLDIFVGGVVGVLYIPVVDAVWLPNRTVVQMWDSVKVAAGMPCTSSALQCR